VLLIGGGAAGDTTAAAFVPAVLAIFGFSGVTRILASERGMGASGIGADTLFASLQSIAMGGVGTTGIVVGTVRGVTGLTFLHDICKKVDDLGQGHWVVRYILALIGPGT